MASYADLYKKQTAAHKVIDLDPVFKKLDKKGDFLIGRLLRTEEVKAAAGSGTFLTYTFDTDEGLVKTKLGGATDKAIGVSMAVGAVYRVEFLGKEKLPTGNSVNRWKIEEVLSDGAEK